MKKIIKITNHFGTDGDTEAKGKFKRTGDKISSFSVEKKFS